MRKSCMLAWGLLLTLCTACQPSREGALSTEAVAIDFGRAEAVDPGEWLSASFVQLATNDSCLLGGATRVATWGDYYLVLDGFVSKGLYVFDRDGRFVTQVGRRGNGPMEYTTPLSFSIDSVGRKLALVDGKRRLVTYSLDDFRGVDERELPYPFFSMEPLGGGDCVWYNDNARNDLPDHYLVVADSAFRVKSTMMEREFTSGYKQGMSRKLYRWGGVVSAYSSFSPTLVRVVGDTIVPAYTCMLGTSIV